LRGLTVIKNLVPKMSLALLCPVAAGSLRKLGNLKIVQNDKLANRGPELMSIWDQSGHLSPLVSQEILQSLKLVC
jgi:hypothetical protein